MVISPLSFSLDWIRPGKIKSLDFKNANFRIRGLHRLRWLIHARENHKSPPAYPKSNHKLKVAIKRLNAWKRFISNFAFGAWVCFIIHADQGRKIETIASNFHINGHYSAKYLWNIFINKMYLRKRAAAKSFNQKLPWKSEV